MTAMNSDPILKHLKTLSRGSDEVLYLREPPMSGSYELEFEEDNGL